MNKNLKLSMTYCVVFLLLSWVTFFWFRIYFIMKSGMAKSMSGINFLSGLPIDQLVYFLLGQVISYAILVLVGYLVVSGGERTLHRYMRYPVLGKNFLLLSLYFSVILLSQYLFPITHHPLEILVDFTDLFSINSFFYMPILAVLVFLLVGIIKAGFKVRIMVFGLILVFMADTLITSVFKVKPEEKLLSGSRDLPHLIIIGVDSYDFSELRGGKSKGFIGNFVNNSIWFENTLTPLARTYVAWTSILTAKYPVSSGVRYNLFPRDYGHQSPTLLPYLKGVGYQVVYSTDERRFANFDSYHGFEKIIGPPAGAADFLLGSASDMPATNILISTTFGKRFFPYSYANRAVAYSYDYRDFLNLYSDGLNGLSKEKPVFMATHLCLAHWPYYDKYSDMASRKDPYLLYKQKIKEVDGMAQQIFSKISNAGMLDNAVVVLLSDHGEGWPERHTSKLKPSTYGHGNNLLDEDQQRVMFAVQRYVDGKPVLKSKTVKYPASLIDVLPTMFGVAGIDFQGQVDGYNLESLMEGRISSVPESRVRVMETEIHIKAIDSVDDGKVDERSIAAEAVGNYRVTSDGRFELTHNAVDNFLRYKKRAIEKNGKYLHWDRINGFTIYNSLTYQIAPFSERDPEHRDLKKLFCGFFRADIEQRFLGDVGCN